MITINVNGLNLLAIGFLKNLSSLISGDIFKTQRYSKVKNKQMKSRYQISTKLKVGMVIVISYKVGLRPKE